MIQSHVVEVAGTFLGAAVRRQQDFQFVAVNERVQALDASVHPSLAALQQAAARLYLSSPPAPGAA